MHQIYVSEKEKKKKTAFGPERSCKETEMKDSKEQRDSYKIIL